MKNWSLITLFWLLGVERLHRVRRHGKLWLHDLLEGSPVGIRFSPRGEGGCFQFACVSSLVGGGQMGGWSVCCYSPGTRGSSDGGGFLSYASSLLCTKVKVHIRRSRMTPDETKKKTWLWVAHCSFLHCRDSTQICSFHEVLVIFKTPGFIMAGVIAHRPENARVTGIPR